MKQLTLLLFLNCTGYLAISQQQNYKGKDAESKVQGAQEVIYLDQTIRPASIVFYPDRNKQVSNPKEIVKRALALNSNEGLLEKRREGDDLGFIHIRYKQLYKNVPVEAGEYILHLKEGVAQSMNGVYFTLKNIDITPSLSQTQALQKAITFVGAKRYKWENKKEIAQLRKAFGDSTFNYDPKGELVVYPKNNEMTDKGTFRLAYKFNIYADIPESRAYIFVDAINGQIIGRQELIHTADVQGTAHTKYSGTQKIMTTLQGSNYVLQETGRGKGIATYDAKHAADTLYSYPNTDFTDSDNDWNNFNANLDEAATDAHWATEMTWDYYKNVHNRNSIDGNGFKLINYVHVDNNWFNANWNGSFMRYGDGNKLPLTAIDIGAHEVTHGVTGNSAGLNYEGASGALNESFSDIFGTCVEWMAKPNQADWLLGADVGTLRDMQYPKVYGQPDTYKGEYFQMDTVDDGLGNKTKNDHGGVHTNSGVQNHWFYILANGEQGINDNKKTYSVKGIGIDKAAKIAYRTLVFYLSPTSNHSVARTESLQAAYDLYGNCSAEYIATAYAWDAVGVAGTLSCASLPPIAGFDFNFVQYCDGNVQFKDFSAAAPSSWAWDFGDGQSSTVQNPVHSYTASGSYTVKLKVTNAYGKDSTVKISSVMISLPKGPTPIHAQRCDAGLLTLQATPELPTYNVNWYAAANGGAILNTGATYSVNLSSTTTYYSENAIDSTTTKKVGPVDSTFNVAGGAYRNLVRGLYFDALFPFKLKTVQLYAASSGTATIAVRDIHGETIVSKKVTLTTGKNRVILDFDIPKGNQYTLMLADTLVKLYRNSGGAKYPYTLANIVSITESTFKNISLGVYYYFYDWEVQVSGCVGPRIPVIGTINPTALQPVITQNNGVLSTTAVQGYTYEWSLNGTVIAGATAATYSPTQNGNYTVKITLQGNCSATSTPYNYTANSIQIFSANSSFKIYPNPAGEDFFIDAAALGTIPIDVCIYSIIGNQVYHEAYTNESTPHAIHLQKIENSGIYFVRIQSNNSSIIHKMELIKK
jgi:Zn-dependent metalloprotease